MDKKSLTKRVLAKLSEKEILDLVSKATNKPIQLVGIFDSPFKEENSIEDITSIFTAIEDKGYINPNNLSVWKKIYDNLGIIYPVNVK